MDSEVNNILLKCARMATEKKVCPDSSLKEMVEAIVYSHNKGYLYTNSEFNTFVCGYRIPEVNDKWKSTMPETEQGEIFFVNFAVSDNPDWCYLLKMLRGYLKQNSDVKELVYFRRNNDKDFKRIHLRRENHGK